MKKKILSFLIAICLIIPCAITLVACKDKGSKIETWDGSIVSVSAAVDNEITIDTAEELAGFAKSVNEGNTYAGVTIKLACDMDLCNRTWTPIGVGNRNYLINANKFAGTFDGNGKKIIGLTNGDYTPSRSYYKWEESDFTGSVYTYSYGLFGMTLNATIKNLTVEVNFDCNDYTLKGDSVGGLVGFAQGSLTVQNCVVNGTIDGGYDAVGGLVGRAYGSMEDKWVLIEDSINNANVNAMFKAAGILGYVSSDTMHVKIDECVNNGTVEVAGIMQGNSFVSSVAGIVNYGWKTAGKNKVFITNNTNSGTIKSCADISEEVGVTNYHGFAIIARSANQAYNEQNHKFDFRGNNNTGKVYYNGEEPEVVLVATLNQLYPDYDKDNDFDKKNNVSAQ